MSVLPVLPSCSNQSKIRRNWASASLRAWFDSSEPTPAACWDLSGSEDQIRETAGFRSGRIYSVRILTA